MNQYRPFKLEEVELDDFYFIAHLFDRVLAGHQTEPVYEQFAEACRRNQVLEAHLFNRQQELYTARIDNQLIRYLPLYHRNEPEEQIITRSYRLENLIVKNYSYNVVTVKQYLQYDPNDHHAYIDQTVLYALERRDGA